MLESEFNGKINLKYFTYDDGSVILTTISFKYTGEVITIGRFSFDMTNIREYFSNFSFDMNEFKENNRIIPVHDFDFIMELGVRNLKINPTHADYIGGFIFTYITFKISEITLDDKDNSITHRTLHKFEFGRNYLGRITKRLHFKANKQYEISFLDDIRQRVIDHKDESYDVDIDYSLRFYYTTDKDRDFDEEILWERFYSK